MRSLLTCLLPGLLMGAVSYSQTDIHPKDSLTILFPPAHFTNHFKNTDQAVAALPPFSLLNIPAGKTPFIFTNPYAGKITWHQRESLWKDLVGFAGQTAIFYYQDTHSLQHYYPR